MGVNPTQREPSVRKFTNRIGFAGGVIALLLFLWHRFGGHAGDLPLWQAGLWPTSILLGRLPPTTAPLRLANWTAALFAAVMNGAIYFGAAWALWWAARLAGWIRAEADAKDRFVSLFLAVGLGFSLLIVLGEAAIHGLPNPGVAERFSLYLVGANLFGLVVITCATSGWILWWLHGLYERRAGGRGSAPLSH